MSAIISTVTAQQWGLLNKPELQAFQKMYNEELLSEGIVFFPVALEHYYPKLGMSKTEFSFMRNLLQLWTKNDKRSWFAQEQIEEIFGKSRRQVQRDARKLAKEGFIIISEWDDLNNGGTHCIHYDCTPFLQMISQLVRVHQHRNTLMDDISTPKSIDESSTTSKSHISSSNQSSGTNMTFDINLIPTTPPLPLTSVSSEFEADTSSVTKVAIVHNHIHMTPGKKFSNTNWVDMYDPAFVAPSESEQPANTNQINHQPDKAAVQRSNVSQQKVAADRQSTPTQNVPSHTSTQADRERARQKNQQQQQTRLPLLSSVVMREVSQSLHDCVPQASQRDTAIIYRRLLLINRIEDDLTIKNPDQYFANLIKSVFQDLMAISKNRSGMRNEMNTMDHFMAELNHAAFHQFEQIKILRYQRTHSTRHQPEPFQIVAQEASQHQLDQRRLSAAAIKHTKTQQRARNFPAGEELVALAHHMRVSMTEEEANEIEGGTASEQLLLDIQDAILLSYDQQPDEIANLNYA